MQWFQHDSDSTQDAKIKKLLIRHGAIGYAVYFHCLELIAAEIAESNLTFELDHDSEIIASNLFIKGSENKSGIQIVEEIMRTLVELDLFREYEGHIFCIKLLKRVNLSMTSNPAFRVAINKKKAEYHDSVMIRHDIVMRPTLPTLPTLPIEQKEKKTKDKKAFQAPELEEIEKYILDKKMVIEPSKFFDWYTKTDWKDNTGKQISNWKNKAVNWDSREKEKKPGKEPYSKPLHVSYKKKPCPRCGGKILASVCMDCDTAVDADGNELK
jgi:hypothetical protein